MCVAVLLLLQNKALGSYMELTYAKLWILRMCHYVRLSQIRSQLVCNYISKLLTHWNTETCTIESTSIEKTLFMYG